MVFFRRRISKNTGILAGVSPTPPSFSRVFPLPEKSALRRNVRYGIIKTVIVTKNANRTLLKEGKLTMRPDTRSLLHGIFNLILPFFAYDLAGLLVFSLTVGDYSPWLSVWPMRILTYLPFLSDLIGVIVGGVRYARRGRTRALLGIIFSVGGAALYYMLRFHLGFTLFGMLV